MILNNLEWLFKQIATKCATDAQFLCVAELLVTFINGVNFTGDDCRLRLSLYVRRQCKNSVLVGLILVVIYLCFLNVTCWDWETLLLLLTV